MALRDYQLADVAALSPLVAAHRTVFYQLPTGAGKTAVISAITATAYSRDFRVWFVVPRNELLQQASEHFARWKVPHGLIAAGKEESRAFRVHVVSKDTLLRRLRTREKAVKNWPDLIIFDEAHLYYDAQIEIIALLPPHTRVMGQSATPERFDGRGLGMRILEGVNIGGPYEVIHYGPSIPWLTEREFLVPLRYFAPPPVAGFEKLHFRGTDMIESEYEEFIDKNKRIIYGDVIKFYRKYGRRENPRPGQNPNKPALIFTRSVKSAQETSDAFNAEGLNFRPIWGEMPQQDRDFCFRGIREERLDGLVNCDLATYGVDIPNLEYGASIRLTLSRALYFQMVGRLLRPYPGKREAHFIDHANMIEAHQDPRYPNVPLFFIPDIQWNFGGTEKRERAPSDSGRMRLCPLKDYQYCTDPACAGGCKLQEKEEKEVLVIDAPLVERTAPKAWTELAPGEKRDVQDRIGAATDAWLAALAEDPPRIDPGPVGELLEVCRKLGYEYPMWVFHWLKAKEEEKTDKKRFTINIPLLYEIGRQARTRDGKPYSSKWPYAMRMRLQEQEAMAAKEKELVV